MESNVVLSLKGGISVSKQLALAQLCPYVHDEDLKRRLIDHI